jgi:class 3 adenylate cyclase
MTGRSLAFDIHAEPARGGLPDPGVFSLPGMERLRRLRAGSVARPRLSHLIGWEIGHTGAGTVSATVPTSPWLVWANGDCDVVIAPAATLEAACFGAASPGFDVRLVTFSHQRCRPVLANSGPLIIRARATHVGRHQIHADVSVVDTLARPVLFGSGSALKVELDPPPPAVGDRPIDVPAYRTPDPHARPAPRYPGFTPEVFVRRAGLDVMRNVLEEGGSAITNLLGARFTGIAFGEMDLAIEPSPWCTVQGPEVCGGVVATLLSGAAAGAAVTLSQTGSIVGIVSSTATLLRGVRLDAGTVTVAARAVAHDSDRLFTARSEATLADGTLVGLGGLTGRFLDARPRSSGPVTQRVLTTVVFTDIVRSTSHASRLGDARWQELLADHDAMARRHLRAFGGSEIATTGDGFLATFDSPARALEWARTMRDGVDALGLAIRAGVHTGECEMDGDDVSGIAVNVAARVMATAGDGEVWASSIVQQLTSGAGLTFKERGTHELRGLDGTWSLVELVG